MKFTIKAASLQNLSTACLVLGVYTNQNLPELTAQADKLIRKKISKLIDSGDLSGALGQTVLMHAPEGLRAKRVLLVGLGKKSDFDQKKFGRAVGAVAMALKKYALSDAADTLVNLDIKGTGMDTLGHLLARTLANSTYQYSQTKSKKGKPSPLKQIDVFLADKSKRNVLKKGLDVGTAVSTGMSVARELGNLPANICTPSYLGEQAIALGKRHKELKTKVLTEAQMKRLGMGSLLSVGHGSDEESRLIIMEYKGTSSNTKPNIIVGKGITFDTGGISLKPGAGMDEMKFDMCGAASVMGAMTALCELKPKINVIGVIASAENMPSGRATKPGDIVTSMSGKTIEVLNTDAEGRLVLCDALTYVERYKPKSVIDIATLTGACIVALGSVNSGLMSNNDELADKLRQHSVAVNDPVWRLPLDEEYQKQLDSNFADIANIGGPKAGTITAGCFLSRFTEKYPWAHIDIAGTAWLQGKDKGATGRPVPLLVDYLLNNA
ncbi:MAG: leucyl aminopeptidase [Pseudohongiellaceae bacterium]